MVNEINEIITHQNKWTSFVIKISIASESMHIWSHTLAPKVWLQGAPMKTRSPL